MNVIANVESLHDKGTKMQQSRLEIKLPDSLKQEAQKVAKATHRSLTQLVKDGMINEIKRFKNGN